MQDFKYYPVITKYEINMQEIFVPAGAGATMVAGLRTILIPGLVKTFLSRPLFH